MQRVVDDHLIPRVPPLYPGLDIQQNLFLTDRNEKIETERVLPQALIALNGLSDDPLGLQNLLIRPNQGHLLVLIVNGVVGVIDVPQGVIPVASDLRGVDAFFNKPQLEYDDFHIRPTHVTSSGHQRAYLVLDEIMSLVYGVIFPLEYDGGEVVDGVALISDVGSIVMDFHLVGVLQHHDSVVDHQPHGQREGQESEGVQGVPQSVTGRASGRGGVLSGTCRFGRQHGQGCRVFVERDEAAGGHCACFCFEPQVAAAG